MNPIGYDQALEIIRAHTNLISETESVALNDSVNRCLAAPIAARFDSPKFDNSAVDGYAVFHENDLSKGTRLRIAAAIAAGSVPTQTFSPGECARIFTGGMVPRGCIAIAMQEDALLEENTVVLRASLHPGENIRAQGKEFRRGDTLAVPGDRIGAGTIACAASQNIEALVCVRKPKAAILSTGDEIVRVGDPASDVQIYDSNGPMLRALVQSFGAELSETQLVRDSFDSVKAAVQSAAERHDLIITAGGASVGDRDYLPSVVNEIGTVRFHKVSIKPGKPVLFGNVGNAAVICLPGNPASAFVGAYLFVRPIIEAMLGQTRPHPTCAVALVGDIETGNRDEFFRCVLQQGAANICGEQSSFGVQSLLQADCLVRVPANTHHKSGELRTAVFLR